MRPVLRRGIPPVRRNLRRLVLLRDSRAGPRVAMQEAREAFVAWLQTRAAGGVRGGQCSRRAGAGLGRAHRCPCGGAALQPLAASGRDPVLAQGQRLDVWVAAPDCRELPARDPAWAVITGADPLVAMEGWPLVRALRAGRASGDGATGHLEGPGRSAGGAAQCRRAHAGLADGHGAGPGSAPHDRDCRGRRVHFPCAGGGHRRGRRHAWDRERALVAQWCAAGLLSPLSPASRAGRPGMTVACTFRKRLRARGGRARAPARGHSGSGSAGVERR
jgi:hypothetical protein